ncbi:HNH endonuclease [Flavobacteriaceae bacterium]|nr:HNH endonuclease [Flavobacteriaceae bacterium]|tara:strand:+ start:78 stop:599 length:522 start_codon:yes stop_codon:yes gene_type:complete
MKICDNCGKKVNLPEKAKDTRGWGNRRRYKEPTEFICEECFHYRRSKNKFFKLWNDYKICKKCNFLKPFPKEELLTGVYPDYFREGICSKCSKIKSDNNVIKKPKKKKRSRVISQNVKNKVWNRDKGRCRECKSNENLEFDHIIPYSKGGANTYRNIQLLCESCNRKKSDSIG